MANSIIMEWNESNQYLLDKMEQHTSGWFSDYPIGVSDKTITITLPLTEDITLDVKTNFKKAESVIPGGRIVSGLKTMFTFANVLAGTTSQMQHMWDLQVWDSTNPIRLDFEILLYTKTDAMADVVAPLISLMSLTVLSRVGGPDSKKTIFYVPGVNLSNLGEFKKSGEKLAGIATSGAEGKKDKEIDPKRTKILKVRVPGIIFLDTCIVDNAKPTYSKERTEEGYPLWAKLQMGIQTAWPANDSMLLNELTMPKGTKIGEKKI